MFFHADQPLETRGDIPVNLSVFAGAERDAEGRWVVSGVVPIRLDVPREVRARVLQRRFEPAFYTDGIFVFETEVGRASYHLAMGQHRRESRRAIHHRQRSWL